MYYCMLMINYMFLYQGLKSLKCLLPMLLWGTLTNLT